MCKLEGWNVITEMRNLLQGLTSRFEMVEKSVNFKIDLTETTYSYKFIGKRLTYGQIPKDW